MYNTWEVKSRVNVYIKVFNDELHSQEFLRQYLRDKTNVKMSETQSCDISWKFHMPSSASIIDKIEVTTYIDDSFNFDSFIK